MFDFSDGDGTSVGTGWGGATRTGPPDPFGNPGALEDIDEELGAPEVTLMRERRRVVVVALALDGGDLERRAGLARTLVALAYKRGGVLLGGDDASAIVAFGLEIAGEDDVATAVAFAVDAEQVGRDAQGRDAPTVRIGARAGVPATADAGGRHRIPADAVDEARQLSRDAQPGRPLLAGGASRLSAAHFAFRELPARRGLHRRARVLEVLGPRSFDERDRALWARRGRFVGRAAALAELGARLDAVIAGGTQQRVLIRGAVGVGKSRLCAEFVARALARPEAPRLVATAATPATTVLPYGLIVELVQAWLGLPPGRGRDGRAQVAGRLAHVLARTDADPAAAAEAARAVTEAMELRDGATMYDPADLRDRVAAALELLRAQLPGGHPQVVVVEDLHQADTPSLDVLRAARADGVAELLVATARPDAGGLPRFEAVIDLGDLHGVELRELVVDRLSEAATPLGVAAVIARAGGNPLFVEELARAVREQGEDAVPATARDVIAARVDRLTALAKTVLQFAAVAGPLGRARILEELVGVGDLSEPLEELCAEGLLIRADDAAPESGEGDLAFARGLVREVVYDTLAAGARRDAHARIGKLLASRFFAGREEPPAVIAEHLERGGEPAGAAAFWLRAGRLSLAADDGEGAMAYFRRTLALEDELGAEPPSAASRARRAEARIGYEDARRLATP
ncbi:MAG: AAA family ATPase [Kofleriaceae bacterium]|nr:AAA family ATPase [Kofleriaceae bacterium]